MKRWIAYLSLLIAVLAASPALADSVGDFPAGAIIDIKFATVTTTGAPTTLSGTPAISVYKDNSTTESTSGVTLSVDFDSRTGFNNVRVDTSSDGTFYSAGSSFAVTITTGTVGGTSVVGYVVGQFTISRGMSATAQTPIFDALKKGTTSKIYQIFIKDARTGNGLTGLTSGSSGLTWYYCRDDQGNAGCTSVTPGAATRGSFTSSGFIEKDATNAPGIYEIGLPNASIATGSGLVVHYLKGVANMVPVTVMLALTDNVVADAVTLLGTPVGASVSTDIATITGSTIKKNIASQNYPVYMVLTSDHISAATGKTLTVTVSKDGAAFGAIGGSVSEIGSGWYTVALAQADTNCNVCVFRATAASTDTRNFYFVTSH